MTYALCLSQFVFITCHSLPVLLMWRRLHSDQDAALFSKQSVWEYLVISEEANFNHYLYQVSYTQFWLSQCWCQSDYNDTLDFLETIFIGKFSVV